MNKIFWVFISASLLAISCNQRNKDFKLPILGRPHLEERMVDNKVVVDTISHTIGDFEFLNQDGDTINNHSFKNNIYIADFFFTSCPTICPAMKKQMLRVYDKYKENDRIAIVSHTIDPEYDTVQLLKNYAEALEVSAPKWNFLTGDKDEIYSLGESSYMVTAGEDEDAAGGYIHSGAFILVDPGRHIRGIYDGTNPDQVNLLLSDIDWLLKEVNGVK